MKQVSTLIGKQTSEDIKSVSNREFKTSTKNGVETLELTDKISFTKSGESYNGELYFDDDGNLVNTRARYTMEISLVPTKTTKDGVVSLDEASNEDNPNVENYSTYIVGVSGKAKAVEVKPNNASNVANDQTIYIKINSSLKSIITTESNSLEYDFSKDKIQINMDLKYCIKNVRIEVTNESKTPLNLCILNKNINGIEVVNNKGILNEYYRSDAGNKKGILYDVRMTIMDERNNDEDNHIFETSFVQNIDIK